MNIIEAISDRKLFRDYLQGKADNLNSWSRWGVILRLIYGLPVSEKWESFVREVTGRDLSSFSRREFNTSLILTGRRSGKSKISALVAAFEASFSGKEDLLSKGELGLVSVISPTRFQSQVVKSYIRGIYESPMLEAEIVKEHRDGFELSNGVRVVILTGDFKSVRSFTQICVTVDEAAFFGLTEESKVRSDTELFRAIKPSVSTVNGKVIAISSPYSRRGWCYKTYKRYFGNNEGKTLVVNAPSRTLNRATLPQSVVDEALEEDKQAAQSEYLGEFRDDVAAYLPIEVVQACMKKGRLELLPRSGETYVAFCDLSGGRNDSASLAIAHKQKQKVILDFAQEYKAPFVPTAVIESMAEKLKQYKLTRVVGDRYAGAFVSSAFQRCGINYIAADKSKSIIYLETIPILCSGAVELLDIEKMVTQFGNLMRKTRSGGADLVDHLPGCKDDLCNSVAGAIVYGAKNRRKKGPLWVR